MKNMINEYRGYELIRAISNGKIEDNTEIEVHDLTVVDNLVATIKYKNKRLEWKEGNFDTGCLCSKNFYFRIIEEEPEIDIQGIEEINEEYSSISGGIASNWSFNEKKILQQQNKILRAVKQLDNKINGK